MKKIFYILPSLFLLAACQSQPTEEQDTNKLNSNPNLEEQLESSKTEDSLDLKETEEQAGATEEMEKVNVESKKFETIEAALEFVRTSPEKEEYLTSKPDDFNPHTYGGSKEPHNFGLDGVSMNMYVLTNFDKQKEGLNRNQDYPFYIQTEIPPTCYMQDDCNEPNIIKYYGPFEGKLVSMLE